MHYLRISAGALWRRHWVCEVYVAVAVSVVVVCGTIFLFYHSTMSKFQKWNVLQLLYLTIFEVLILYFFIHYLSLTALVTSYFTD